MIPRTTIAQKMDVLSSQANLAGDQLVAAIFGELGGAVEDGQSVPLDRISNWLVALVDVVERPDLVLAHDAQW